MRIRHALLSCAVSMTLSIGMAPPAVAQSFFQKLFGVGSAQPGQPIMRPQLRPLPSYRFHYRSERRYQTRPEELSDDEQIGPPDSGGPYRTMCVRACDGFYFPLRHNAWRRNFGPDAKSCRSACGDESRLFYYSLRGGSVDTMVDLAGRPYQELPHAFGYRKTLVSGCTCKPVPWSYEESARHRQYEDAENEAARLADARQNSTAVAVAAADQQPAKQSEADAVQQSTAIEHLPRAGEVSQSEQVAIADTPVTDHGVRYEPMAALPQRAEMKFTTEPQRAVRRRAKPARVVRAKYSAGGGNGGGLGLFGASKSKYVWPGDAH